MVVESKMSFLLEMKERYLFLMQLYFCLWTIFHRISYWQRSSFTLHLKYYYLTVYFSLNTFFFFSLDHKQVKK